MKKLLLPAMLCLFFSSAANAAMRVDIYGPGQNIVNLALAAPITGPQNEAAGMGRDLQQLVEQNLGFLPFVRLTNPKTVLGGTVLAGYEPPSLDFRRFQLAGSDILVTSYWPSGDSGTKAVQLRAFETNTGGRLFGKEYARVSSRDLPEVADRFCADLLEALTGSGAFFQSTLAFVKKTGTMRADVWLVKPTGRELRQITNMPG
ncbi:MAG: translocation protein TolB, partial [Desulfovibrio sp.]|nr:translocation protein TolB [Desulfovibrio sp.]